VPFTFTTDAVYPEQFGFDLAGAHVGYIWHDYGAVPFQVNPTFAWTELSPSDVAEGAHWFGSAGAAPLVSTVGFAKAFNTQTFTIPVTGTVPVGRDLIIAFAMVSDLPTESAPPSADITVTDNKGGNVLRFGAALTMGFNWCAKADLNGFMNQGWCNAYRINTQLIAGDTITVSFTGFTVFQVQGRLHVVTGLNDPDPTGPNAGGNYVEVTTSQNAAATPVSWTFGPGFEPKWVGPTFLMALVIDLAPVTYEVSLGLGGLAPIRAPGSDPTGKTNYDQSALPGIELDGGCTVEIASCDQFGNVRTGDQVTDVRLWIEDES
jgi:hypothetical protein